MSEVTDADDDDGAAAGRGAPADEKSCSDPLALYDPSARVLNAYGEPAERTLGAEQSGYRGGRKKKTGQHMREGHVGVAETATAKTTHDDGEVVNGESASKLIVCGCWCCW